MAGFEVITEASTTGASQCHRGDVPLFAVQLLGGDKTGDANWYVDAIRRAEAIYAEHLIEIGE